MDDDDLLISNGTCYFGINKKAANTFIPCGNAANAPYACCLKGDVCLESSVCFHPDGASGGTTYVAGCTDAGFASGIEACPIKGPFADQQIVGLVRCHESDDDEQQNELWAGCSGDASKTLMTGHPPPCSCSDADGQGLFRQRPTLSGLATLPTALRGTINFNEGHTPLVSFAPSRQTASASASGTTSSASGTSSMTAAASSRSLVTASTLTPSRSSITGPPALASSVPKAGAQADDQPGFSTRQKVGITIGLTVAVLICCGIAFLAFRVRRRNRSSRDVAAPRPETHEWPLGGRPWPGGGPAAATSAAGPPGWGFKFELPADESSSSTGVGSPASSHAAPDGAGKGPVSSRASAVSGLSSSDPGTLPRYSPSAITPQATGSDGPQPYAGYYARNTPAMAPISELYG